MIFSPVIANAFGRPDVSRSVAFVVLLMIAYCFIAYAFMDKKLDAQTGEAEEKDDPFRVRDLGKIFTSLGFCLVALLCVLYIQLFSIPKICKYVACNLDFVKPEEGSFWASNLVAVVQYIVMLVVQLLLSLVIL